MPKDWEIAIFYKANDTHKYVYEYRVSYVWSADTLFEWKMIWRQGPRLVVPEWLWSAVPVNPDLDWSTDPPPYIWSALMVWGEDAQWHIHVTTGNFQNASG